MKAPLSAYLSILGSVVLLTVVFSCLERLRPAVLYTPLLVLFGGMAPHPIATFVMFRIWGFVNHANIRFAFGGATPFLAGPQWHRIHHSTRMEQRDRNFAAFFPFLDILFGTYYEPRAGEYPETGLTAVPSLGPGKWR